MSSAQKKVVARRFGGQLLWGYLPQDLPVRDGALELIDPSARVTPLPLKQLKWIAYVRNFNLDDPQSPERLERRRFPARPRTEGLWLRLRFRDGDLLEGLVDVNVGLLETMGESQGLFVTPPDTRGNTQRLFIPRDALQSLEPLALIGGAAAKVRAVPAPPQPTLFHEEPNP